MVFWMLELIASAEQGQEKESGNDLGDDLRFAPPESAVYVVLVHRLVRSASRCATGTRPPDPAILR